MRFVAAGNDATRPTLLTFHISFPAPSSREVSPTLRHLERVFKMHFFIGHTYKNIFGLPLGLLNTVLQILCCKIALQTFGLSKNFSPVF